MADHAHAELPYGQFGIAVYDPDEQIWSFERDVARPSPVSPLGLPKSIAKAAHNEPSPARARSTALPPNRRYTKQIRDLVKLFPELQPASDLFPPLLRVSEAVESAAACNDQVRGNLFAIGTIPSEAAHRPVSIAAFPTGRTGSDLRLIQVQDQRRGWDDTDATWIEVPTIHGEEAVWKGEGVPIQQICFAHAVEGTDMFLAVRLPTRSLIFRPSMRREPMSSSSASRLNTNLVFEVLLKMTGGMPHADVAFNPWYTRQVGIVDQAGHWSIWELEGRSTLNAKCICTGFASSIDGAADDGWSRITWVSGPSTVAVCTRRRLALYTLTADGSPADESVVLVDLVDGSGWLLDLVLVPSQPSLVCVLTSSHITLYRVGENPAEASAATSVRHYRNPEDMTLSFSAFRSEHDVLVLLRSSLDPAMTVYRLSFERSDHMFIADPSHIVLPEGGCASDLVGLHLAVAPFGTSARRRAARSNSAHQYRDVGVRFLYLSFLGRDLSLHQVLCHQSPARVLDQPVVPPTWESKIGVSTTRLHKESFVVEDEDNPEARAHRSRPVSSFMKRRRTQVIDRTGLEWTISFELVARAVDAGDRIAVDVNDVLMAAEDIVRSQKLANVVPWRTLSELSQDEFIIADIYQASGMMHQLATLESEEKAQLREDEIQTGENTRPIVRPISQVSANDLSVLYDGMVRDWITPLSAGVPGRVRLAKDQLAQRAAAEVAMASHVIRTDLLEQPSQSETQPTEQSMQLPVRGGPSSPQSLPPSSQPSGGSSQLGRSQQSILPTPSPSATPSITTASSHPSTFAGPEISRLSRYTTFSKTAPSSLPRSLNNVLTHWTVGADPAFYDWRSTSRRIAQREDDADEHMTEKERARMQKRAERHIRRQRREAAASQAAHLASNQAPEIAISASQPVQRVGSQSNQGAVAGSSQSQGFGIGPASQVVPGRFGGRPPKKKRKQGF